MTTPAGGAPDGAYVVGDNYGQDVTEQSAKTAMTSMPVGAFEISQEIWKAACSEKRNQVAPLKDGQFALNGRIDLLEQASGYGSAVMRYTWNLPYNRWINLPFDVQLGPVKGVEIATPEPETGFLVLKKGGLWRIDTHQSVMGYAISLSWYMMNGILIPIQTNHPIYPKFRIEVWNAFDELITARQFAMVSDQVFVQEDGKQINAPKSGAFSHTFVLPDMPPEDDPDAPNHWVKVKVAAQYQAVFAGMVNDAMCWVYGGTGRSSLIASRWSPDVANVNYVPEVPDGGDLG